MARRAAHYAVVGNGPLSEWDRIDIGRHVLVVRLNDAREWRPGDRMTRLVVRYPSARSPPSGCRNVPLDCVTPVSIPHTMCNETHWVYEPQYRENNILWSDARLFPDCPNCPFCYHNQTYAGPSTGAVVLSALQVRQDVRRIDVYGMNWNGDSRMHVDFSDRTLVRRCCTKCVVHSTASPVYRRHFTVLISPLMEAVAGVTGIFLLFVTCLVILRIRSA